MTIFTPAYKAPESNLFWDSLTEALCERAKDVKRTDFEHGLWAGFGDGQALSAIKNTHRLEVRPLCFEGADERFAYPQASLDLIVVCGVLDSLNDLPGALIQMRRALKPDGLFLAAFIGGASLQELRGTLSHVDLARFGGVAPRLHPMADAQSLAALLQRAGFGLPVADTQTQTIYYRALGTLLKDIQHAGRMAQLERRARRYVGRTYWDEVESHYKSAFAGDDGLLPATIEVLHAIGWGPAENQQKPLPRGSANARLQDFL